MTRSAVVAMSGGVDSSVAAALMKEDGWDVTGIMLKLWSGPAANNESGCCSVDAAEDARRVAQVLDIPFYMFNFAEEFARSVVEDFVAAYAAGRTPNPCVTCNRSIKFSALARRAAAIGADVLATDGSEDAVAFAALTGLAAGAAKVAMTRKAAQYYEKSAGHLPQAMQDGEA